MHLHVTDPLALGGESAGCRPPPTELNLPPDKTGAVFRLFSQSRAAIDVLEDSTRSMSISPNLIR